MADFNKAAKEVLGIEKGYSNHISDSGGATMYGITEMVARNHGYKGDMRELPLPVALEIYKKSYWDVMKLDFVKNQIIAEILFDIGVNAGTGKAKEFMQRAINLSTRNNIDEDLKIGKTTLDRTNDLLGSNIEKSVRILTALASEHYIRCCEVAEKNEDFLFGWLRRAHSYLGKLVK